MKILWIVNSVLPNIAIKCGIKTGVGGGWLSGISDTLILCDDINLIICFPHRDCEFSGEIERIKYYSFLEKKIDKYDKSTERRIKNIIEIENPALIHVFGTEFPHSLAAIKAAEGCGMIDKTVISIQGLVSVYAKHFYADLGFSAIHKNTLRDFLKRDNIYWQCKKYIKRGKFEQESLRKAKNVIGRTDWDEACVKSINDNINYYFCNETLRKEFYDGKWEYELCERHSIFVGSSSYPIKGFHSVIKAIPEILNKYPDAKVYVTGKNPFDRNGLKGLVHKTYYNVYLKKLIKKYHLKKHIFFLGNLSAEEMKVRMLKSNVYILSSSIENSPNTLGEAMMLGVPCIVTDVGGVRNMARDKFDALIYPFEESYMLPFYVDKIFVSREYAEYLSENATQKARLTHSKEINGKQLIDIYNLIGGGETSC